MHVIKNLLYKFFSLILLVCLLFFIFIKTQKYYKGKVSDHFDGNRFHNKYSDYFDFISLSKWLLTRKHGNWPNHVNNNFNDIPPPKIFGNDIRVCFVGHSTFLLQTHGLNIITDPIFSKKAGLYGIGVKRVSDPGILIENLPKIDVILISHPHHDHLDIETLKYLWYRDKPIIIMPLGNDQVVKFFDENIKVFTYDWGDIVKLNDDISIIQEQAIHWSSRWLADENQYLWSSFVIKTPSGNIFFAGDSAYLDGKLFRDIYKKYGNFKLSLLPIGAFKPINIMRQHHMSPEEAILAFQDLHSSYAVPMHYNTFKLADDGYDEALNEFYKKAEKHSIDIKKFRPLSIGEAWIIKIAK